MSLYMHIYWALNASWIVYIGGPYNKLLPINIAVTGFSSGGKLNRIFFSSWSHFLLLLLLFNHITGKSRTAGFYSWAINRWTGRIAQINGIAG